MMFLVLTGEKYLVEANSIEEAEDKLHNADLTDVAGSLTENGIQYLETDTWVERIA